MRPLLFLHIRTFINGIKRAFSSPTRVIGVLFFIVAQFSWFGRFFFQEGLSSMDGLGMPKGGLKLPPMAVIDAIVFGAFCVFMLLFVFNLFNNRTLFRSADVDVLFPTPVDPKTVLVVRVLRDVWISLIVPLVFSILLWKPVKVGWASLFQGIKDPSMANTTLRVGTIAFFLSAIAWVWIGHALSLLMLKPDVKTERWRNALSWTVGLLYLGYLGWLYFKVNTGTWPQTLLDVANDWDVRAAFFLATAATSLTMAPLTGEWAPGILGLTVLVATSIGAIALARSKTRWMYEAAALRANVAEASQKLRKSGDLVAMAVSKAQSGKTRAVRQKWIHRVTVRGPLAMVWKEALVQGRISPWMIYSFSLLSVGLSFMLAKLKLASGNVIGQGAFILFVQSMFILGPAMSSSQSGFIESLRRIDLLKPIPFASRTIVFFEVVSKAMGSWVVSTLGLIAAWVANPALWQFCFGGIVMFPCMTLALSAMSLLLVLLLPDVDDPTQRGFRGLATLLGFAAMTGPPIVVFAGLAWLKVPIFATSCVAGATMVALAWLCSMVSGRIYESFNPAE